MDQFDYLRSEENVWIKNSIRRYSKVLSVFFRQSSIRIFVIWCRIRIPKSKKVKPLDS